MFNPWHAPAARASNIDPPVIIAVFEWAPYSGRELHKNGFAIEIVTEILEKAGYETSLTYTPWTRALKGIASGRYHILPGAWFTEDRNQYAAYSKPLVHNRLVIISHRKSDFRYTEPRDLTGKHIGIAQDYAYPDWFLKADYFSKETALSLHQNLKKIIFGRIDHTIGDELVARYTAKVQFGEAAGIFLYSQTEIESKPYHILVSRKASNMDNLLMTIDAGIDELAQTGKVEQLMQKYLDHLDDTGLGGS